MKRVLKFIKSEAVFCLSIVLALISSFIITPNKQYIDYIDYRVLAILLCLMLVVEGLSKSGFFIWLMEKLLSFIKNIRGLVIVLWMATFFSSMFITNDVALITFVPFAIMILKKINMHKCIAFVVIIQTVAANLGSMLLPTGNPSNLYLYSLLGLTFLDFIKIVIPYVIVSLVMILLCVLIVKNESIELSDENKGKTDMKIFFIYAAAFITCILTVVDVLDYRLVLAIVLGLVIIEDVKILKKADYILLLTFIMFFIFVGNIKNMQEVSDALKGITSGNEVIVSVALSQVISNVPASLLLSGFATNLEKLIVGVNIGGLGTLIASMASLISFKLYSKEECADVKKYLIIFTIISIVFLAVLLLVSALLN